MDDIVKTSLLRIERLLKTDIRYLLHGGGWLTLGQGISTGLSLAVAVAFANLLSKADYGTYKYILSVVGILSITTLSGMANAVLQSVARKHPGAYLVGLREKLRWGSIGSVIAFCIGIYYAVVGGDQVIGSGFIAIAPFITLMEGFGMWGSVYGAKREFKRSVILNTLVQILTSLSVIGAIIATSNVAIILLAYGASYTIARYLVHRHMLKDYPELTAVHGDPERAADYGKKLSLTSIISTVSDQIDTILIWHFLGAQAAGAYAFAMATTTPAKNLMKSLVNLAFPKFAEQSSTLLKAHVNQKIIRGYLLFIPVTIVYISILPTLYKLFFPLYLETVAYGQVLGLIFLFFPLKLQSIALLTRLERTPVYVISIVTPIISTVGLIIAIPMFGVWGAICVHLFEYITSSTLTYYYFRKMKDQNSV